MTAFVHDEFHTELPLGSDYAAAAEHVDQQCCRTMEQLTLGIPIACEFTLSDRWSKQAQLLRNDQGQLLVWSPDS